MGLPESIRVLFEDNPYERVVFACARCPHALVANFDMQTGAVVEERGYSYRVELTEQDIARFRDGFTRNLEIKFLAQHMVCAHGG